MQEIQTIQPSTKDRIKAAELLGKRYRMWTDKHEVEITTPIFIDDVPEEEHDNSSDKALVEVDSDENTSRD
mgnify:FL=1